MGLIRLSYSVGRPPGAIGYSLSRVNNGTFFNVSVSFDRETVTLNVNGEITRTRAELISAKEEQPKAGGNFLEQDQILYLGALPKNAVTQARQNVNIRETFSFGGCIKAAYINDQRVDFKGGVGTSRHKLVEGCPNFFSPVDPCLAQGKKAPCHNHGVCRPMPGAPHAYKCHCKKNYTGRNCEIKACKRLVSHEYYVDEATKCRSRRRLKIRRCRGTCSSSSGFCCKPKRFKTRYVKFRCPFGLKTRRVKMIRRCGCRACGNRSDDNDTSSTAVLSPGNTSSNELLQRRSAESKRLTRARARQRRRRRKRKRQRARLMAQRFQQKN